MNQHSIMYTHSVVAHRIDELFSHQSNALLEKYGVIEYENGRYQHLISKISDDLKKIAINPTKPNTSIRVHLPDESLINQYNAYHIGTYDFSSVCKWLKYVSIYFDNSLKPNMPSDSMVLCDSNHVDIPSNFRTIVDIQINGKKADVYQERNKIIEHASILLRSCFVDDVKYNGQIISKEQYPSYVLDPVKDIAHELHHLHQYVHKKYYKGSYKIFTSNLYNRDFHPEDKLYHLVMSLTQQMKLSGTNDINNHSIDEIVSSLQSCVLTNMYYLSKHEIECHLENFERESEYTSNIHQSNTYKTYHDLYDVYHTFAQSLSNNIKIRFMRDSCDMLNDIFKKTKHFNETTEDFDRFFSMLSNRINNDFLIRAKKLYINGPSELYFKKDDTIETMSSFFKREIKDDQNTFFKTFRKSTNVSHGIAEMFKYTYMNMNDKNIEDFISCCEHIYREEYKLPYKTLCVCHLYNRRYIINNNLSFDDFIKINKKPQDSPILKKSGEYVFLCNKMFNPNK